MRNNSNFENKEIVYCPKQGFNTSVEKDPWQTSVKERLMIFGLKSFTDLYP
jgi:hypothetical protein